MAVCTVGDATIHYEVVGAGYPLLALAPGGLDSAMATWSRAAIDPLQFLADDFTIVTMDQRNSYLGHSTGPLPVDDPWGAYARDQLGLMDHLGFEHFHVMGCCVGCSFALKLLEVAPGRVSAAVLEQPNGLTEENRASQLAFHASSEEKMLAAHPHLDRATFDEFMAAIWSHDFVISVDRAFVATVTTPLLVLPGIDLGHPTALGHEIAALARAATVIEPWKEPAEALAPARDAIRSFLLDHVGP
jgi:pimeloyl-ACP methyl ester carboxylesterase